MSFVEINVFVILILSNILSGTVGILRLDLCSFSVRLHDILIDKV
jgi:hypothetical protein